MAISQGFNLPPTGRIGQTTTGYRSGNYNLRVIPDVEENAERSDKQKAENSNFGFLSDFINSNLEFFKLGFPKAYQPLNRAIKVNRENVIKTADGFEIDFEKFKFSDGKLAPVSPNGLTNVRSGQDHYIRLNFIDDYTGGQPTDMIFVIYKIEETGEIFFYPRKNNEVQYIRNRNYGRCYTGPVNNYRNKHITLSIVLYNGQEASRTIFFGTILANWN